MNGTISSQIDLGWPFFNLQVIDNDATTAFYTKLGFSCLDLGTTNLVFRQGWSTIYFFDWDVIPINFRGLHIRDTAEKYLARGIEPARSRVGDAMPLNEFDEEGSGHFVLKDSPGFGVFFNSDLDEVVSYQNWVETKSEVIFRQKAGRETPINIPLGEFMIIYSVPDYEDTVELYTEFGFEILQDMGDHVTFSLLPHHASKSDIPESFLLRIEKSDTVSKSVGFRSEDPDKVAEIISKTGIPVHDEDGTYILQDPNGHRIIIFAD